MSGAPLLALAGVWTFGLLSPGPDVFLVANRGVAKGRSHAVAAAAGVVAGIELWIVASLLGLGALLHEFPQARALLSLLGGGYLLFLGAKALRSASKRGPRAGSDPQAQAQAQGLRADFLAGLMTNLGNPKALVFFGALLLRFVPPGSGPLWQLAVWAVMTAMACAWFGALALLVSRPFAQRLLAERIHLVHYATGAVFLLLGAVMVAEGLRPAR